MPAVLRSVDVRALLRPSVALAAAGLVAYGAHAQRLTRPVYRVAAGQAAAVDAGASTAATVQLAGHQEAAASPVKPAVTQQPVAQQPAAPQPAAQQPVATTKSAPLADSQVVPAAATAAVPFDLEPRPGEHPLMPCLRLAKSALSEMDARVRDYSATFTKRERLDGELGDPQKIELRVRHQPFSVYMKFVTPNPGQEALYVEDQNNGKLVAMGSGWKRRFGKITLDPEGSMAMKGQRYPITKAGIKNLSAELVEIAEQDVKYAECTVRHGPSRIDGRPTTMIEAVHPVPRKNFRFHKAQIFLDNELRIPVAYRAYSWPTQPGGEPILEEQYIYTDVKLNNGFTDEDFSADNPALFQ